MAVAKDLLDSLQLMDLPRLDLFLWLRAGELVVNLGLDLLQFLLETSHLLDPRVGRHHCCFVTVAVT